MRWVLVMAVIGLGLPDVSVGEPNTPASQQMRRVEERSTYGRLNRSRANMAMAARTWLARGRVEDAADCDLALDEYLAEEGAPRETRTYLLAAKIAWLRVRPGKAIYILDDLIRQHGEETVDGTRVETLSRLWQASIQRYHGSKSAASSIYSELLERNDISPLTRFACHVYLAELELAGQNRKDRVLAELDAGLAGLRTVADSQDGASAIALCQAWVGYKKNLLDRGKAAADAGVSLSAEAYRLIPVWTGLLLSAAGTHTPGAPIGEELLALACVRRAVEASPPGTIDRDLGLYMLGIDRRTTGQVEGAEGYFRQLSESSSSMALSGGIEMAKCQVLLGRENVAKETMERVKNQFRSVPNATLQDAAGP